MKKIIIWILMCILLVGVVSAALCDDLSHYYEFNSNVSDTHGNNHLTNNGADNIAGKVGNAMDFISANSDYLTSSVNGSLDQLVKINHTISFWLYNEFGQVNTRVIEFTSGANQGLSYISSSNGEFFILYNDGAETYEHKTSTGAIKQNGWIMVTGMWNASTQTGSIHLNATGQSTTSDTGAAMSTGDNFGRRGDGESSTYLDGRIDEFGIWDRHLTQAEITELYNSGAGYNYSDICGAAPPASPPENNLSISWTFPLANHSFNAQQLEFNFSVNVTNASQNWPVNCSLYQNGTLNDTINGISNTNVRTFNLTYDNSIEQAFSYYIDCVGAGSVNETTENRTVYIDSVDPTIATNLVNFSFVITENLTAQINFSDPFLYSFNISIDGVTIANNSNMATDFYSYNLSRGNFSVGTHTISVRVSDGHTAKTIPDYYWQRDNDMALVYRFADDWIKILPKNTKDYPSWFDTRKETDRYVFDYSRHSLEKLAHGEDLSFRISSSRPVTISARNDYPGWLIIDQLNKWIDFDTTAKVKDYEVIRINANTVDVVVKEVKEDQLTFHSIGELNTVTENYTFYQGNYTFTWVTPVLEQTSNNFMINFTINNSYITDVIANISYNSTLYPTTKINTSTLVSFSVDLSAPSIETEKNITFNWTYTLVGVSNHSDITSNQNQQVYPMGLTNCSAGDPFLLYNISITDESNLTPLNAELEAVFEYWYSPYNVTNVTYDLDGYSNYHICRLNNFSFYVDAYIRNTVNFTHRYYLINDSVSAGSFENIRLYNFLSSTDVSDLKGTVRDATSYNYFENVIAILQRFYASENVWRTVQMDESGDFGLVFFNVIEENTDYRLVFRDRQNHILKTTESMKFVCTSEICDLTFLLDPFEATDISTDLIIDWTFDNDTNFISVDWIEADATETTVRTRVRKNTMTGTVLICDTTQTGSSGSVNCNASAYTGEVFLMVSEGTNSTYLVGQWISLESTTLGDVIGTAEAVLWTFAIVLIIVMFGLFSPVGAVISTILGLIIIFYLGIFGPITVSFIIVAAALGILIGVKVRS